MSHLHPILRRHIFFHIVFSGIFLWLLCEDESLQHLDALIHRGDDSLHPLFVDEFLRTSEHLPDVLVNAVQLGEVEPVKGGHQPQLVLMGSFEGLAGDISSGTDLGCQLVVAQGGAAVIDGRRPQPFQSVRVAEQAEVVILSRLVDTFISKISLTMLPVPKPHNTACVLSWEEARRWQSRSSGYSSS